MDNPRGAADAAELELLDQLLRASPEAVLVLDGQGEVLQLNGAGQRLLGRSSMEGVRGHELLPDAELARIRSLLDRPDQGGEDQPDAVRAEVLNVAGERVPVSIAARLLRQRGERPGLLLVITDLSQRLTMGQRLAWAEERLASQEKLVSMIRLAATTAHELNQPLTSVMGYAELLGRRMERDDSNRPAVETIIREAQRLADVVRKISQLTQYETGHSDDPGS